VCYDAVSWANWFLAFEMNVVSLPSRLSETKDSHRFTSLNNHTFMENKFILSEETEKLY